MMAAKRDSRIGQAYSTLTLAEKKSGYERAMYAKAAQNSIQAYLSNVEAAEPVHIDTYEMLPDTELVRIALQQVRWAMQHAWQTEQMREYGGEVHEFMARAEAALRVLIGRYDA